MAHSICFLVMGLLFSFSSSASTLTIRMNEGPLTLDWTNQSTITEAAITLNTQEGLFRNSYPSKTLVPGIASSVKKSKDLKEYTFTIRKGAKWSDGRPILAQDFVYGWLRAFSSQSTSLYSYYFFDIVNAQEYFSKKIKSVDEVGIKAPNDTTLVVSLKKPHPNWESQTAFWPFFPARKDLIEKNGANGWRAGVLASSGPFVIESYEAGTKMILNRNPEYPKNNSPVDQIVIKFNSDFDASLKEYEENKIDILTQLPYPQLAKLNHRKDKAPIPLMQVYTLGFNAQRFPVNNRDFRLALLKALDRKKLFPIAKGHLKFVDSLIPPPLPGSTFAVNLRFNIKEAKELLKKSGVVIDQKLKIEIISPNQEPFHSLAKAIQEQLIDHLGINVSLNELGGDEYATYNALGEYSMFLTSWSAKIKTTEDFLKPYAGYFLKNKTHFFNSTYDQLLELGNFRKAQKLITTDEAIVIPLCTENSFALVHSNVKNIYFDQMGVPHLINALVPSL